MTAITFDANCIDVSVTAASGESVAILAPDSGCMLSISGMTSGNVYLEQMVGSDWVQYPNKTFTSDMLTYQYVTGGIPVRVTWDSVVGTPKILLTKAGNDGFASTLSEVESVKGLVDDYYTADISSGNVTISNGVSFGALLVAGSASGVLRDIIFTPESGENAPIDLVVLNQSDSPVSIYYQGNSSNAVIVPSGNKCHLINIVSLLTFFEYSFTDTSKLYSYGAATTVATNQTNVTILPISGIEIPAYSLRENGTLMIAMEFSYSGAAGTTINAILNDGSSENIGSFTFTGGTSGRVIFRISSRNSLTSQRASALSLINMSTSVGAYSTTRDFSKNCTLSFLATTGAANTITLQSISVMMS